MATKYKAPIEQAPSARNQEQMPNPPQMRRGQRIVLSVATTLFLGAVGSGIWEVMFRPGLSTIGKLLSAASTWFQNEIYTTAALDPQPLPGLILLLLLCAIPLWMAGVFFYLGFINRPVERALTKHIGMKLEQSKSEEEREIMLVRLLKRVSLAGVAVMLIFASLSLVGFTLQNEATKVWRIFNANLEICAVSMPELEVKKVRSQFRQMKSKADFDLVKSELEEAASRTGSKLNWYGI